MLREEYEKLGDLRSQMNRLPLLRGAGQARLNEPLAKTDVTLSEVLVVGARSYHVRAKHGRNGCFASDLPRLERVRSYRRSACNSAFTPTAFAECTCGRGNFASHVF